MKKSKAKTKSGHGGARPGAGGGARWKHGKTKLVRLPIALVDEILEVARYMDENGGKLPCPSPPAITSVHSLHALPSEELKEFSARQTAGELARKVMAGDEEVLVSDNTFRRTHTLTSST
jgi:hypothetical protein